MSQNGQSIFIITGEQLEDLQKNIVKEVKDSFSLISSKPIEKKLLTKEDFAEEYGFTLGTINNMVLNKKIEYIKPNNKIHFRREVIEQYLKEHTQSVGSV